MSDLEKQTKKFIAEKNPVLPDGKETLPDISSELEKLKGKLDSERFSRMKEITEQVGVSAEQKWKSFHAEMRAKSPELIPELPENVRTRFENTKAETVNAAQKALVDAKESAVATAHEIGGKEFGTAVKTGDVNKMAQIASDNVKKLGSVAEFAVKLDQAATEMEEKGGIFTILAMVLRWFSGIANVFVSKADREKIDAMKKKAEGVAGTGKGLANKADNVLQEMKDLTPEKKKELVEKAANGLAKDIGKKYFGGAEIGKEKLDRLKGIVWETFSAEQWQKVATRLLDKGELNFGDLADLIANEGKALATFVWKMALSGILPVGKIAYDTVETSGRFTIALTLDGLRLPPAVMEMSELSAFLSKHASGAGGEYSRDIARMELYRPMGLFYSVLGGVTAGLAKTGVALLADTASGANGFDVAKGIIKSDYGKVAEEFEKIEKALGKAAGTSGLSEPIKALSAQMETVHRNWKVLAIAKEVGYDQAKFLAHKELAKILPVGEIEKVRILGIERGLQEVVSPAPSRPTSFTDWTKRGFGTSSGVIDKFARDLDGVQDFQRVLARPDGGGWQRLNKAAEAYRAMKIARHGDVAVLHLENADDVSRLKSLHALWPEGLAGFFKTLPAASFVASGIMVATGPKVSGESTVGQIENALKMALLPIYGSWSLLRNVTVSWDDIKAGKMPELSNMALSSAGAVIFAMEATRILSGGGLAVRHALDGKALEALKTVGRTGGMHALDLAHSLWYVFRGMNHVRMAGKPALGALSKMLASGGEKLSHMKGRYALVAAGVLVAGGATAAMLEKKTPEEHEAELKKNGWLDTLGNPSEKFFQNFPALGNDVKKEVLDTLFSAKVDKQGKNPDVSFDPVHGEYAIVTEKASERSQWQEILDADASFRDQLAKFGIDVKVVSREEIEKLSALVKTDKVAL